MFLFSGLWSLGQTGLFSPESPLYMFSEFLICTGHIQKRRAWVKKGTDQKRKRKRKVIRAGKITQTSAKY